MRLRARWGAFEEWLAEREPATAQAAFRAAVGLVTVLAIAEVGAMHRVVWLGPVYGGYDVPDANWLVRLLGGASPATP